MFEAKGITANTLHWLPNKFPIPPKCCVKIKGGTWVQKSYYFFVTRISLKLPSCDFDQLGSLSFQNHEHENAKNMRHSHLKDNAEQPTHPKILWINWVSFWGPLLFMSKLCLRNFWEMHRQETITIALAAIWREGV